MYMILYHGSNVEVKEPKIIKTKRLLDFGTGFYLTSDFEQAKNGQFELQLEEKKVFLQSPFLKSTNVKLINCKQ